MDKFDVSQNSPKNGMPLHIGDFAFLQDAIRRAIRAGFSYSDEKGNIQDMIVSGCTITGSLTSTFTVNEGFVYINGEVLYVPQHDVTGQAGDTETDFVFEIFESPDPSGNKTFADGVSRDTYLNRISKLVRNGSGTLDLSIPRWSNRFGAGPDIENNWSKDNVFEENLTAEKGIKTGDTADFPIIQTAVFEIGPWNMDSSTKNVSIPSSVDLLNVVDVQVIVYNDAQDRLYDLMASDQPNSTVEYAYGNWEIDIPSRSIFLGKTANGGFDSSDFNSTSINRGFVKIQFKK